MKKHSFSKAILGLLCFLCLLINTKSNAQVNVVDNQTANALSQKLVGNGVQVFNATLNCPGVSNGIFTVVTSNLGLDSGIVLTSGQAASSGTIQGVNGPNTGAGPSLSTGVAGDPDLNTVLAGITSFDACVLEFDFLPAGDTVKFDYCFASTEYQSFSCSNFNDVFGFFISGPGITGSNNIAKIPGTNIPICVNSTTGVTTGALCTAMGAGSPFSMYYINNANGATITYRGFTTIFTAISAVTPWVSKRRPAAFSAHRSSKSHRWLQADPRPFTMVTSSRQKRITASSCDPRRTHESEPQGSQRHHRRSPVGSAGVPTDWPPQARPSD